MVDENSIQNEILSGIKSISAKDAGGSNKEWAEKLAIIIKNAILGATVQIQAGSIPVQVNTTSGTGTNTTLVTGTLK